MSDFISRKIAVQGVMELFSMGDCYCDKLSIIGMLNSLPSAELEREKGKWQITFIKGETWGICSNCNFKQKAGELNFCPNCGAKME